MTATPDCPRCAAADSDRSLLIYLAARRLGISALEWDALNPDDRRAYAAGLVAEGLLVLPQGIAHRTADTGTKVVDLREMVRTSQAS